MLLFATEFPIAPTPTKSEFISQVIAWLRGATYSTVLEQSGTIDKDDVFAHLATKAGEELRFRDFQHGANLNSLGFRHDNPDNKGRVWRTEGVLRRSLDTSRPSVFRVRTQCFATTSGAEIEIPRKPFLIKSIISDGWGGSDSKLIVQDKPHILEESESGLEIANLIITGQASSYLPVLYVSSISAGKWTFSDDELRKISYDLGGVAHVVVEPSRSFSFSLRDATDRKNVYGGAVGVSVPGRGIVRRFLKGPSFANSFILANAIKVFCTQVRSQMPAESWDWTELQEQAFRHERENARRRLSADEVERLYLDELASLRDRIVDLEEQLFRRSTIKDVYSESVGEIDDSMSSLIGPEIYIGEIYDRIKLAAQIACESADRTGLDNRSREVLNALSKNLPTSTGLTELREDLARSVKDPRRIAAELSGVLCRHGYTEKSENKHLRLEAKEGFIGLNTITISKTPSENRGLKNMHKQVEATLGLTKLAK